MKIKVLHHIFWHIFKNFSIATKSATKMGIFENFDGAGIKIKNLQLLECRFSVI
ncbi:hypothetical protein KJK34_04345 [Flavobacterium sp. D11R37]|uniref:hypothetical protein n=1 Tax=Flavobacterium coralii TaxID=2838017 RepID=UPI001CA70D18|nr:hypothetical protein [Flavobacterium coralii]MBY8961976.1 hypothetical protein [Flavobacterium coralii]